MATLNAKTLQDTQYSGPAPAAHAHGKHTLAAAAIGDKVRLVRLYAGTKVYAGSLITAALGAGSTMSLGFEATDGSALANGVGANSLLNAQATNAAGKFNSANAPFVLDKDAYLIGTVGGAVASGQVDAVISYEHRGV
ncbi:hypothetical protein ACUXAV_000310 [Cupriavidus metallidurans]|uniref:hypothetical protein n=1 Tax=Cupriavidus metallidurans TaxID=119219 RepID=UPI00049352CA|nr:hypothetical protein [Cupriavidus metallidurans]MDE4918271.1 hypothetical protein [Cupriavidus metallidurans]